MYLHTPTARLVCTAGANHFAYFYGRCKVHWDQNNEWKSNTKIKTAVPNVTNPATNWNFYWSANGIIHFKSLVRILLVYIFVRRILMKSKGQYLGFVVPCIFKYSNKTSNQRCGGGRVSTRPPPHSHGNRRLRLQFERAPDDGHDGARNMLSGIYVTKQ
jgi:hypothetical protein